MAATSPSSSGDNAGLVNISHNQVPIQGCNDNVPVNVLGVQVPVNHVSGAGNLLDPGSTSTAGQDTSCHQASGQANSSTDGTGTTGTMGSAGTASATGDDASAAGSQTVSDPATGTGTSAPSSSGDSAGLVNISHNQVPVQACNDEVPVNVLGVQVPVYDVVAALGILAPVTGSTAGQDTSCHQGSAQANG